MSSSSKILIETANNIETLNEEKENEEGSYVHIIKSLQDQIESLQEKISNLDQESNRKDKMIETRNGEIDRLSKIVADSGDNLDVNPSCDNQSYVANIMKKSQNEANAMIIDQLNAQVDFLNAQLATKEHQLAQQLQKDLNKQNKVQNDLIVKIKVLEEENLKLNTNIRLFHEQKINTSQEYFIAFYLAA